MHATINLTKSKSSTKDEMPHYVARGQNEVDGVSRAETMFAYWIYLSSVVIFRQKCSTLLHKAI